MNKKQFVSYQDVLLEDLKDQDEAIAYLNAALADEDPRIFLVALKNILAAQGITVPIVAKKTSLNRENLYRILSEKGNPTLMSTISILQSVGLNLAVQPLKK
jgi:probable addiction module antidote protein